MKNQSINRTWNAGKVSAILAIFAFASLSGCVINSSDVASVAPPPTENNERLLEVGIEPTEIASIETPQATMALVMKNSEAANGEIKQGSASQSSHPGNIVGLVTAVFNNRDPRVAGQLIIDVNKGDDQTWGDGNSIINTEEDTNLRHAWGRNGNDGSVYRYIIDRATPNKLLAIEYYTDEIIYDDEYIVGGVWRDYERRVAGSNRRLRIDHTGVFVDVLSGVGFNFDDPIFAPSIGFRTVVADFVGWGRSIVSYTLDDGTYLTPGRGNQEVVLHVNFGTEQIGGTIRTTPQHVGPVTGASYRSEVILKDSTFDPNNRGFLSDGEAEWVWRDYFSGVVAVTVTGTWGGQFYNPNAKVFAGTYGVDRGDASILGFFGAYDRSDCSTRGGGQGTRPGDYDDCVALTGSCSPTGAAASEGEYDREGRCVALQGSCDIGNFVGNGMREDITGVCIPASGGECIGSGVNAGLYDGTG
ncbi:MAG: hypothetical protein ACNYPH_07680 [Gammaproteobacteria bacterium WSBS_2016_MAG_OTU1]